MLVVKSVFRTVRRDSGSDGFPAVAGSARCGAVRCECSQCLGLPALGHHFAGDAHPRATAALVGVGVQSFSFFLSRRQGSVYSLDK